MKNKIDLLFKHAVGAHGLPNSGPAWDDLEKRIDGNKRKPLLFFGLGILALISIPMALFMIYKAPVSTYVTTTPVLSIQKTTASTQTQNTIEINQANKPGEIKNTGLNYSDASSGSAKGRNNISRGSSQSASVKPKIAETITNDNVTQEELTMQEEIVEKDIAQKTPADEMVPRSTDSSAVIKNDPVASMHPALKKKKPGLIYVFVGFDPSLIHSTNLIYADKTTHKNYSNYRSQGEKLTRAIGYDFGVLLKPLKNVSVSTGLVYEQRTEEVNYQFKNNEAPVIDSATGEIFGYIILNDTAAEKINYSGTNTYTYVGIPLKINYNIAHFSKWNIGMSISTTYLKQTKVSGKTIDAGDLKLTDLKGSNELQSRNILNGGLGLNISYSLGKNLSVYFNPQYNSSFTKNTSVKNLGQTSLTMGLQYKVF